MSENNVVRQMIKSNKRMINLNIYEREESRPVIVFIPGMGCYASLYDPFLLQLSEQGFTVIGVDLTGHGLSEGKRGGFLFEDIIHNIRDAASFAVENYNQNIGLLGSSFGGICALYASIFERRFKAVLCHNAINFRDFHRFSRFPALFCLIMHYLLFMAKLFPGIPVPLSIAIDWGFKSIDRPVKMVVGENGTLIPSAYVRTIYEQLDPSCRDFEIIPGAGHMLPLEYAPQFLPVVTTWFRRFLLK